MATTDYFIQDSLVLDWIWDVNATQEQVYNVQQVVVQLTQNGSNKHELRKVLGVDLAVEEEPLKSALLTADCLSDDAATAGRVKFFSFSGPRPLSSNTPRERLLARPAAVAAQLPRRPAAAGGGSTTEQCAGKRGRPSPRTSPAPTTVPVPEPTPVADPDERHVRGGVALPALPPA